MSNFPFEPVANLWLLGALALVLAAALMLRPSFGKLSWGKQWALAGMRLGVLAVVVALLLQPSCVRKIVRTHSSTLIVMADQSRSMQLGSGTTGKTRWQVQLETLAAAEPALANLQQDFQVKAFAYDTDLHPREIEKGKVEWGASPEGKLTAIGDPLAEAVDLQRGNRLAGVVLLGDGTQTASDVRVETLRMGRELARLDCPLFVIPIGGAAAAAQARDIAVTSLPEQYSVFEKTELLVEASLQVRGFANKDVPVELIVENPQGEKAKAGGMVVNVRENDQQVPVQFRYSPPEAGQYMLTVRAPELPRELVTQNNELSSFLNVRKGGLRVLYLEGSPRLEQKFLRQALGFQEDASGQGAGIQVDFLWIDSRTRHQWPVDLASRLTDPQYDALILGDLDSSALSKENWSQVVDRIDRGLGLLVLGGFHSFGAGGYGASPLAEVLPVEIGRLERQDFGAEIRVDLHHPGPIELRPTSPHFLTRLAGEEENERTWRSLPPLEGANRFSGVKSRSVVRLESVGGDAMLVSGQYGSGRVLAFAGDSTWKWWMKGRHAEHRRFWRQTILWLTQRENQTDAEVRLQLAQRRIPLGNALDFTATVPASEGTAADPTLSAVITLPDGSTRDVSLSQDDADFAGTFAETRQTGGYLVTVDAQRAGKPIGSARARFMVYDHDVELAQSFADPQRLARLAAQTSHVGGHVLSPEELPRLLEEIRKQPPETVEVESQWQLGRNWPEAWLLFIAIAGFLTGEWVLRKQWGLI